MATLAELRAKTRRLLQDDQYDADVITDALNWFIYELGNNNKLRLFETSTELSIANGDTGTEFPTDMLAWTGIYLTSPQVYDLSATHQSYADFMAAHANFATATPAQARDWTTFGRAIRLAQPANADHSIQLDYVREPVAMEADDDECEIPDRYTELVARGAKARVLDIEEDYQAAQEERIILEPLVTAFVRNEARGAGSTKPQVIRTGRGTRNRDR